MGIKVNGQSISVTRNLENALRGLRKADRDMVVWADAICINHQDSAEKSVQVSVMGNIYAKGMLPMYWRRTLIEVAFSNRSLDLAWTSC
jgi:hypothetical protein